MAFVPRLPTFHLEMTPYHAQFDYTWDVQPVVMCQLYTLKRVAEVIGREAMYVVYPKEDNVLRDPLQNDRRNDAVMIDTGQGEIWYWVFQVEPRWAGFPNAHWMALLFQMTPSEVALVQFGPPPTPPPGGLALAAFGEGTCTECDVFPTSATLTPVDDGRWESGPIDWDCAELPGLQVVWVIVKSATFIYAALQEVDYSQQYAVWTKDLTLWTGSYPIFLGLDSGGNADTCDWPAQIAVDLNP